MYDVGQGNNIKDKPHVFEIDFSDTIADTIYQCDCTKRKTEDTKEGYTDTTQHTKAGEPSDIVLLTIAFILAVAAIGFLIVRKNIN
jgi:hypothetical protein